MMTLALYKRPLIILTLFLASALGVYFLAPEQRYAQWQWTQSDEALPTIARYDLIHSYPAQDGALLLISKRSESGAYNSFYGWAANYLSQVLFTGPKGLQMLGQLDELIYDAVCAEQECVLFLSKGRRLVDVQRGTLGALIPWPEGDDSRPSLSAANRWRSRGNARCISSAPKAYSTARTLAPIGGKRWICRHSWKRGSCWALSAARRTHRRLTPPVSANPCPRSLPPLMAIACCSG